MMRIIGEPRCTVQAFDQSESEIGKVILDFNAKFFLPGDAEPTVDFSRLFAAPPETLEAFATDEEEGRDVVTGLLTALAVPALDSIVDPVLAALVAVSVQTEWSLGLKATVTIDVTVQTLPPPPLFLTDTAILHFNQQDRDHDQVRLGPASESSIRALETVRVSETEAECSVCLEDLTEATRLPCSHTFHGDCILKWFNVSNLCPLCRFPI